MGSSKQTTTSKQENEPWAPAQPALKQTIGEASRLYDSGVGQDVYGGPVQAGLSSATTGGLNDITGMADGGGGLLGRINANFAGNLVANNGLTDEQRGSLNPFIDTASGKYLSQPNPYLTNVLDTNAARIADRVNSAASAGGRYGSGMHTGVLSREISNATMPILAQNYENERQRQLEAAGILSGTYGQGANRALQAASMGSDLTQQLYDPAYRKLAVGSVYDQRAQTDLDAEIDRFNQRQSRPWEVLGQYQNIAQGIGGMGGTITGTQTSKSTMSPFQMMLSTAAVLGGIGGKGGMFGQGGMFGK